MAFTGTSLLSLPIITTGTESGAWGNITNNGLTQYLDTSIAGALSITSSITLANTSGDATGTNLTSTTAQYRTLVVPASGPSANIVITAPSSNRTYHVVNRNATYTVQIRAGANSGVTLGVNQSATVTYNSTSADYELVGVVGASTATDNAVARFDGTTGEIIQNSGATIDDSANLSTTGTATATKLIPTGNVTAGNGMYLPAANTLAFSNNGSETMRINSSGNVGIGTSSPSTLLHTSGTVTSNVATGNVAGYVMSVNGTATGYLGSSASSTTLDSRGATFLSFQTNGSERARIDSSGNLLVGATTYAGSGLSLSTPNSSGSYSVFAAGDTGYHWRFGNVSNGIVGAITTSTTATTYSTSSDYRLKENIAPMTGALSVVQQLKPCTYIWKADGSDGQGFIAHELAEVCPQCVTGEKDAVDAEGKPVYQGIDTSFLVATLTAAIQEQQALINELRARVAALESQP